jgi:hypothetical protein
MVLSAGMAQGRVCPPYTFCRAIQSLLAILYKRLIERS